MRVLPIQALSYLKKFGSVVDNRETLLILFESDVGDAEHLPQLVVRHLHLQKVEGNVTFHTTRSTAFPQPAPGTAPSPRIDLVCITSSCPRQFLQNFKYRHRCLVSPS